MTKGVTSDMTDEQLIGDDVSREQKHSLDSLSVPKEMLFPRFINE